MNLSAAPVQATCFDGLRGLGSGPVMNGLLIWNVLNRKVVDDCWKLCQQANYTYIQQFLEKCSYTVQNVNEDDWKNTET